MYDARVPDSLKILSDNEQSEEKPTLSSLALSATLYERALAKLKARTLKKSPLPAVMVLSNQDISTLGGRGVGVAVRVGVRVAVGFGVGVRVAVGFGVGVRVGLGAARTVTVLRSECRTSEPRYSFAVTRTLPARQVLRVGYKLVVAARLMDRLSDVAQLVENPARELLVSRSTLYERVLSKLKARTVNLSLLPAVMELDSADISTLGGQ